VSVQHTQFLTLCCVLWVNCGALWVPTPVTVLLRYLSQGVDAADSSAFGPPTAALLRLSARVTGAIAAADGILGLHPLGTARAGTAPTGRAAPSGLSLCLVVPARVDDTVTLTPGCLNAGRVHLAGVEDEWSMVTDVSATAMHANSTSAAIGRGRRGPCPPSHPLIPAPSCGFPSLALVLRKRTRRVRAKSTSSGSTRPAE